MPLMILGAVVTVFVAAYMYFLNNQDRFVAKKEPIKGPFNVIYLPANLDENKQKDSE